MKDVKKNCMKVSNQYLQNFVVLLSLKTIYLDALTVKDIFCMLNLERLQDPMSETILLKCNNR